MKLEYDHDEVLTALCIYEFFINTLSKKYKELPPIRVLLDEVQDEGGQQALREIAVELTRPIDKAWEVVKDNFLDCFDWDFLPALFTLVADESEDLHLSDEKWIELAKKLKVS